MRHQIEQRRKAGLWFNRHHWPFVGVEVNRLKQGVGNLPPLFPGRRFPNRAKVRPCSADYQTDMFFDQHTCSPSLCPGENLMCYGRRASSGCRLTGGRRSRDRYHGKRKIDEQLASQQHCNN
jgi:hypothetical protein